MNDKLRAIIEYLSCSTWGIIITLSLLGWGGIVNYALGKKQSLDWGHKAALGVAFTVFFGGILNVTWTISKPIIFIYLGIGLLACLIQIYQERASVVNSFLNYGKDCRKDKLLLIGTVIVLGLILLRYAGSITANHFNPHDDYQGYFVFPKKMLQLGSISLEPFNARRLVVLGGQSFLDSFIVSVFPEKHLNIMDAGVGLIFAVFVLMGLFKIDINLTHRQTIFLLFIFLVIRSEKYNITSVIMVMPLFIGLYRTLVYPKYNNFLAHCSMTALVASAVFALKSNLIIAGSILLFLIYLGDAIDSKLYKKIGYEFLCTSILLLIFLSPWMISMYQSSGSFLYPILGKGYGSSVLSPASELTIFKAIQIIGKAMISLDFVTLALMSFILVKQPVKKLISRDSPLSLIITSGLGIILLCLAVGGHNIGKYGISQRYNVSYVIPTIIILMAIAWKASTQENLLNTARSKYMMMTMLVAGMLFAGLGDSQIIETNLKNIRWGLSSFNLVSREEVSNYTKLSEVTSAGETILMRLEKPFLLDFKHKGIFVIDMPGGSSLPPGMPFFQGSEALADYLTSKSIRYVAYSYASEAGFARDEYEWMLDPQKSSPWYILYAKYTFDFQDNLKELGETRKRIYDDGNHFVLDLQSPKNP